jgi:hypothetical protein
MLFSHPHPTHLTDFHHHRHNNDFVLDPSSNVYNPWHNSPDFPSPYLPALSSSIQHPSSDPVSRTFHNITYQPFEPDDRHSRPLLPMLPYNARTSLSSATNTDDARSSRSLNFGPIYPSPSYTLSAAIPSAPQPPPLPPLPPSPPPSAPPSEPLTSPSPSHSSLDSKSPFRPPSLPSIHAFRLDTLQSVDPSDDPCPLSLHDLMIPTEEQEYQGHSYHFSLQSVSPSKSKSIPGSDQKPPPEESSFPKRKGKSKMHTCSICQKSFPRPSGLRTHMNSHSGDKRRSFLFLTFLSHPDDIPWQHTSALFPLVPSHSQSALMRNVTFGPMEFIHHLLKLQGPLSLRGGIPPLCQPTKTLNGLFVYVGLARI